MERRTSAGSNLGGSSHSNGSHSTASVAQEGPGWLRKLKKLDLYNKIPITMEEATPQGTIFSIVAMAFMVLLFHIELYFFLASSIETMVVLDQPGDTFLRISFNVTMLDLPCEYVAVDVLDVLGTNIMNVTKMIDKWTVDPGGVLGAYQGRNRLQSEIKMFDEKHVDLVALHANGVHVVPLNEENFPVWLEEHEFTFVDFYAPWCIWCQRLAPTWEALAEEQESKASPVTIVSVDCDEQVDLCMKYKIQAFPAMRLFNGNIDIGQYMEDRTVDAMSAYLTQAIFATRDQGPGVWKGLQVGHEGGCAVSGLLFVNRVPGNFHLEARSTQHNFNPVMTNLSHVVNSLSMGPPLSRRQRRLLSKIPEEHTQLNPMDGGVYVVTEFHDAPNHYIKVVGSEYDLDGYSRSFHTYQMLISSQVMHFNPEDIPEARFTYDVSPMAVKISRVGKPFYSFITNLLALLGGAFSVVGLVDAAFYQVQAQKRRGSNVPSLLSR